MKRKKKKNTVLAALSLSGNLFVWRLKYGNFGRRNQFLYLKKERVFKK
jgi:hypothetical protein